MPETDDHQRNRPILSDGQLEILVVVVLGLSFLYLFAHNLGSYGFWDPWEPKYAQAMREMAERGDFVTPYLDGEIRWTKPILIYWAMYVPMAVIGNNELSARLPSAIAALCGLLFVYFFLRRLRGRWTALMAACVLGTLPQYYFMARQTMPDMMMTAFLAAAMGCYALARFGSAHHKTFYLLFYASMALAFLTKGPVACVIACGAIFFFLLIRFDPARLLSKETVLADLKWLWSSHYVGWGLVVFLVIAAPWYLVILAKHGTEFIDAFWGYENLQRFQAPIRGHHGSVTYYFRALFHGMYPWIGMLPIAMIFYFNGRDQLDEEAEQRWYYFSWFLAVFLLFSIAGTKLQHYMLPITPSVAVLVALAWERFFSKDPPFWMRSCFFLSIFFVFLPIRDFLVEGDRYVLGAFTNRRSIRIVDIEPAIIVFIVAWAVVMLMGCFLRRPRMVAVLAILLAYGNGVYYCHHVLPNETIRWNLNIYLEVFEREEEPGMELISHGKHRYSIDYYAPSHKVHHFESHERSDLVAFVEDSDSALIISEEKYSRALIRELREVTGKDWYFCSREHPRYDLILVRDEEQPDPES